MTRDATSPPPTLLYLYGPPAVGKLTVAQAVQQIRWIPLFHNHLTVNALTTVFEFRSPAFNDVLHRVRHDVFATAIRNGISLIFTNSSIWAQPNGNERFLAFAEEVRESVEAHGGRCAFVRLTAGTEALLARVDSDSRRAHDKLVNPTRLAEMLAADIEPIVPGTMSTVDTTVLEPSQAAAAILDAVEIGDAEKS